MALWDTKGHYHLVLFFGYQLGENSLYSLVENLVEWERENPKEHWPNVIALLGEGIIYHYGDGLKATYTNSDLLEAKISFSSIL